MDKRSGQHPGDDLGVAMRMVGIARSGAYQVVVVDQQLTEGDVARVVVLAEGEAVVGFGPVGAGEETLLRPTQLNARRNDPRRAHWFSIAGLVKRRAVDSGVRSPHVASSRPGTHCARARIGLGLPAPTGYPRQR